MLAPSAKLISGAFARDRAVDTALAGCGVSAALVSVGFAIYMITVGPQGATTHGAPIAALPAPAHAPLVGGTPPTETAGGDTVDFTPTGTVPIAHEASAKPAGSGSNASLNEFVVRDVFDGTALIEAHGTLQMVHPGETLDGAGEVLSIERKGRGWIVKTAGGTIRQRR